MKLEPQIEPDFHRRLSDDIRAVSIVKTTHEILKAARKFFDERGFLDATPLMPHLTGATGSCENLDTTFTVNFYGQRAYLAQTKQLHLETLVPLFHKVWCIGSSFRAEPYSDERHLSDFCLLEFEEASDPRQDTLEQLLRDIETLIHVMIKGAIEHAGAELDNLHVDKGILELAARSFPRVSYDEAVELVGLAWGEDLKREHEKRIVEVMGNVPVFITHFPRQIKFFNMRDNVLNPRVVNSADLILPHAGEAVGAAEREYEYPKVKRKLLESRMLKQLVSKGGSISDFGYFLENLRLNGSIPHAGCGIGLNRVVQFACQFPDIRSTTLFPIYKGSLY